MQTLTRSDRSAGIVHRSSRFAALLGPLVTELVGYHVSDGHQAASFVNTITFGGFAVLALVLAFVLYRPLLTRHS